MTFRAEGFEACGLSGFRAVIVFYRGLSNQTKALRHLQGLGLRAYLDPEEPAFVGFLIMSSLFLPLER